VAGGVGEEERRRVDPLSPDAERSRGVHHRVRRIGRDAARQARGEPSDVWLVPRRAPVARGARGT
jgi:hypothetical protein